MKARGVIISLLALIIFFTAYAKAHELEPEKPSTAAPVMVPYLNKSINEVIKYGNASANSGLTETSGTYREEPGEDPDPAYGATLTIGGVFDTMPELVGTEAGGDGADPVLTYLGEWTTTGYCPCVECCGVWATGCTASGVLATSGHTVACGILPFGTQIVIDGIVYTVEDTGVDGEWVDIFFDTHEEALAYGMRSKSVYLLEE